MVDSVQKDRLGPDWPLGIIVVVTPGTPVNIMSLVDPNNVNSPNTLVPPNTGAIPAGTLGYIPSFNQIMFQGLKKGGAHGLQNNTGNIYIVRLAQGSGSGNRDDYGDIVGMVAAGGTLWLPIANPGNSYLNPYRYLIDADNASDAALVTGWLP